MNRSYRLHLCRTVAAVGLLSLGTAFAQIDRSRFLVIENGWLKLLIGFALVAAAIVLAVRAGLPTWLKIFSIIAGVCGILAPFYFTLGIYLIWVLVFGTWAVVRGGRQTAVVPSPQTQSNV